MSVKEELVKELDAAMSGEPWHGPSLKGILKNITVNQAFNRPISNAHSIAEITLHIIAWTEEVAQRLAGGPPNDPERGDWPNVEELTDEKWTQILYDLSAANQLLILNLTDLSEEDLNKMVGAAPNLPVGSGISHKYMLHGLAQHHAYHGGQISLLAKFNN